MLILLVACLIFIPVSYAGLLEWFIGLGDLVTGSATTLPNITVSGIAPVIENISFQSGTLTPSDGSTRNLIFSFLAMDANSVDEFDNKSALMNVSYGDGGETRWNDTAGDDVTCFPEQAGTNSTAQNYTCTIAMQYWDIGGDWNCTAQVSDTTANATPLTVQNCFSWGQAAFFNMTNSSVGIAWESLSNLQTDKLSTDELNITNTGNRNITNVTLEAINLIGEKTNTEWIPAENFTAAWADRKCDDYFFLINDTQLEVSFNGTTGGSIDFASPTATQGTSVHNSTIYICLEEVGSVEQISEQSYSTANDVSEIDDWSISVAASGPA